MPLFSELISSRSPVQDLTNLHSGSAATADSKTQASYTPSSRRLSRIKSKAPKQGEYLVRQISNKLSATPKSAVPTMFGKGKVSSITEDFAELIECNDATYKVAERSEAHQHTPWRSFSRNFPALAASMRDEFPFWNPTKSTTQEIHVQFGLYLQYHPIYVPNQVYYQWYEENKSVIH